MKDFILYAVLVFIFEIIVLLAFNFVVFLMKSIIHIDLGFFVAIFGFLLGGIVSYFLNEFAKESNSRGIFFGAVVGTILYYFAMIGLISS